MLLDLEEEADPDTVAVADADGLRLGLELLLGDDEALAEPVGADEVLAAALMLAEPDADVLALLDAVAEDNAEAEAEADTLELAVPLALPVTEGVVVPDASADAEDDADPLELGLVVALLVPVTLVALLKVAEEEPALLLEAEALGLALPLAVAEPLGAHEKLVVADGEADSDADTLGLPEVDADCVGDVVLD